MRILIITRHKVNNLQRIKGEILNERKEERDERENERAEEEI